MADVKKSIIRKREMYFLLPSILYWLLYICSLLFSCCRF